MAMNRPVSTINPVAARVAPWANRATVVLVLGLGLVVAALIADPSWRFYLTNIFASFNPVTTPAGSSGGTSSSGGSTSGGASASVPDPSAPVWTTSMHIPSSAGGSHVSSTL